jgi:transposase
VCRDEWQARFLGGLGRSNAPGPPDIYLSQPGLGVVLAARVLGEFGDDPARFSDARGRKNYSGQSPITRASGKKTIVLARYATNRRLSAALHLQAFAALTGSPGARAYYDTLKARKISHHAALRQLANRLVGILHGCLKTGSLYDEDTAWQHHRTDTAPVPAEDAQEQRLAAAA